MTSEPTDETWTRAQVAAYLKIKEESVRGTLSRNRWNVPAVGHRPGPDGGLVAVWSSKEIRAAAAQRAGRGRKAQPRVEHRPGLDPLVLRRLLTVELAGVAPLPAHLWQALAQMLHGVFVDTTWVEQPGEVLAQEIEDATGYDEEFLPEDGTAMAAAARSWTRVQALAVIDAVKGGALGELPSFEQRS